MGFFTSKKVFTTSQQIKEALFKIVSLDLQERSKVLDQLNKELDGGGVTKEEIKEAVRQLRLQKQISEIDQKNLLDLLKN